MSRFPALSRATLPYAVLAASLLLTAAAASLMAMAQRARDRARFANAVESTRDRITGRLDTYTTLLRGAAGLFAASDTVTRADFREYVGRLHVGQRYPGIQGVGFSRRVTAAELRRFLAAVRAHDAASFHLWPDSARAEYHTIVYLEPQDRRNQAALGYDMFTDSTRRAAMERARDQGGPASTGRVTLVQEIDARKQPGFLLYVPVYRGAETPPTVAARRAALAGFVYAPFRAGDLFAGIFGSERSPRVDFAVYDGGRVDSAALLHASGRAGDRARSPAYVDTRRIEVAGRVWTIVFQSTHNFESAVRSLVVPLIVGGVTVSVVLFLLSRAQLRARGEAEEANRLNSQYLANMSHEIRTPINAVIGYTQLLEMEVAGPLNGEQQAQLHRIRVSSEHLLALVSEVLDLAKVEAGQMVVATAPVLARTVADAALALVAPQAARKELSLTLDWTGEGELCFRGDEQRARQIVVNLLANAVKFTPSGGRVTLCAHGVAAGPRGAHLFGGGPWVAFDVEDTGIGIAEAQREKIFEPFVQGDGRYTREQPGTGLGLTISRRLARLMGGDVTVSSTPGKGSCFTLWLPAAASIGAHHPTR